MPKFDMGAAWEDSMVLLRSHGALTWAIAAVFLFLPTLAVSWFGPTPIQPATGWAMPRSNSRAGPATCAPMSPRSRAG
jgi:hypothetical protein